MSLIKKTQEQEVYSTTGFKDVLASPLFFPIAVITLVLGISSIFGFLQNPMKLKTVVSIINQKVSPSAPVSSRAFTQNVYSLSESFHEKKTSKESTVELYQDNVKEHKVLLNSISALDSEFQHIAFNYDITSPQFWNELDSSDIESVLEESNRVEQESAMVGIPLEADYQPRTELDNDSAYRLKI